MTAEEVISALKPGLKSLGFRYKRNNWYRTTNDLYEVVNLQRSWGETSYINIGFSPREDAPAGWLAERHCKVRFRVDALSAFTPEALELLDGEGSSGLSTADRRNRLDSLIVAPLLKFLNTVTDFERLRTALLRDVSRRVMIHKDIRYRL